LFSNYWTDRRNKEEKCNTITAVELPGRKRIIVIR
jgi:hypothetical protein